MWFQRIWERLLTFSSIDVSFISLTKVLPPVRQLLKEDGEIVCLIKPQFEAGREKVGKKGVVRDPQVHREVIEKVRDFAMGIGFGAMPSVLFTDQGTGGKYRISASSAKVSGRSPGHRSAADHGRVYSRRSPWYAGQEIGGSNG